MLYQWKIIFFTTLLVIIYSLFFYLQITFQMRMDFYSFYAAALAYSNHLNPFQDLITTFSSIHNKLPPNLNPPAFITLMSPIIHLNVTVASSLWFFLSLISGIWGSLICFSVLSSKEYFRRTWLVFVLIYLATYANLINAAEGQVGNFLLFFVMAGYYCFLKQKDYYAGVLWGLIITIKLFPGLLFLFVLVQKRYRVFFSMLCSCIFLGLVSLQSRGITIYSLYFEVLSNITWYGINWNGSIYGYIFRLLVSSKTPENIALARTIYYSFFIILLCWYIKKIYYFKQKEATHTAFCFTIIMMLLLSPLGWIYYFTLLIMPLTFIWYSFNKYESTLKNHLLWASCLLFINFPAEYTQERYMGSLIYKFSFYSIYFYGLLLSLYLLLSLPMQPRASFTSETVRNESLLAVKFSLGLGLFIIVANLIQSMIP